MANTARLIETLCGSDPSERRLACEEIAGLRQSDEFVPALVTALGDRDHGVSEAAMNALMEIGGRAVAVAVAPLLRDREARLRNRAIEILICTGSEAAPLMTEMLSDPDDDVVKFAVDILGGIKDASPAPAVASLLTHPNANVRGAVVLYMGRVRPYGAAAYITEALGDTEQWVRFSAVEALGLLGDIRYLEPLLEIVRVESGVVREAAVDALAGMATTANSYEILMTLNEFLGKERALPVAPIVKILEKAAGAPWDVTNFERLRESLSNIFERASEEADIETRKIALRGFVLIRDARGIGCAIELMDSMEELDEETEEYVIKTLAALCGDRPLPADVLEYMEDSRRGSIVLIKVAGLLRSVEALPALEKSLEWATKEKARAILTAVDKIGSSDSKGLLHKSLYSHDGHVRKMAAKTFARIAGEAVTDDLFAMMLRERYRDVIEGITGTLAGLGTEKVRLGFINLISNSREDMREMACMGLGIIGSPLSIKRLVEATEDKDPSVRKMAYVSLSMIDAPEAAEAVVKGLCLGDEGISMAILDSISAVAAVELREAVRERLGDSSLWVRHHAAALLGEIMDLDSEGALINILENDAPPVKAAAAKALAGFASKDALPVLKGIYEGADPSLRAVITRAIEEIQC